MPRKTLDSVNLLGDASESGSDFQSPEDNEQTDYSPNYGRPSTGRGARRSVRTSIIPRTTESGRQSIQIQTTTATSQSQGAGRRKGTKPVHKRVRVFQEIRKLQSSTKTLIPRLPFSRLVKEILFALGSEVNRMTLKALEALQESAETYVTYQLQDAYTLSLHRGRVTLTVKDMELLRYLRGP